MTRSWPGSSGDSVVDTSGIVALVGRDDPAHAGVVGAFEQGRSEGLATHTYVVVETLAVARRQSGPEVTAVLIDRVFPEIEVILVDADLHAASIAAFRDALDSSVSLVDCTSFA